MTKTHDTQNLSNLGGSALRARSDFARGQRTHPETLALSGDFATGVRAMRSTFAPIGDFATGMRTLVRPDVIGDFATGIPTTLKPRTAPHLTAAHAPARTTRSVVSDEQTALAA